MATMNMTASQLAPATLHVIGERCRALFPVIALCGFEALLSELDDVEATVAVQGSQTRCSPLQAGTATASNKLCHDGSAPDGRDQ
jgi:hypothetical protein